MKIQELDETFQPKTELGKEMKKLVESGEYCDGNIYWLIHILEKEQEENEKLKKQLEDEKKHSKRLNMDVKDGLN